MIILYIRKFFVYIKERIEANKRIVAEREREKEKSRQHNRGISR